MRALLLAAPPLVGLHWHESKPLSALSGEDHRNHHLTTTSTTRRRRPRGPLSRLPGADH
jgi:hypothetical protein